MCTKAENPTSIPMMPTGSVLGQQVKPLTVGNNIDREIESLQHRIVHLYKVRDEARRLGLLDIEQQKLGEMVYPSHPF